MRKEFIPVYGYGWAFVNYIKTSRKYEKGLVPLGATCVALDKARLALLFTMVPLILLALISSK